MPRRHLRLLATGPDSRIYPFRPQNPLKNSVYDATDQLVEADHETSNYAKFRNGPNRPGPRGIRPKFFQESIGNSLCDLALRAFEDYIG